MKVNVGRIVKKRVWTATVYRCLGYGKVRVYQKVHFTDLESAYDYVALIDSMKDEDVRISLASKTLTVIEEA